MLNYNKSTNRFLGPLFVSTRNIIVLHQNSRYIREKVKTWCTIFIAIIIHSDYTLNCITIEKRRPPRTFFFHSSLWNGRALFAFCTDIPSTAYCRLYTFHWSANKALLFFNSLNRKQQERKPNHPVILSFYP